MKKSLTSLQLGQALFLLILLGFIWGSGYSLAKYAMLNQVSPMGYAFWQSAGPAFLLFILCLWQGRETLLKPSYWPYYLVCGLLGISIPNTNMYFMANHLPAGLLAVLVNIVPLLVYPLALCFKQEKFDLGRIIAVLLGMSGIALILAPAGTGLMSPWVLLTLITPCSFALCSIYIGAYQPKAVDSLSAACGMLIAATLFILPLMSKQQAFYSLMPPFTLPKLAIILEIVLSSAGYLLFFKLIRLAGPVFYSLTGGVVALTGLFWGYVLFQESPSSAQSVAVFCIILAIFLLSWRQSSQNLPPLEDKDSYFLGQT